MPAAASPDATPSRAEAASNAPPSRRVLEMRVDAIEAPEAVERIVEWAAQSGPGKPGRYICAANVHMTMEAHDHPDFAAIVNDADLVLADGVPMVWALRALGLPQRRRVRIAPDLLYELFRACESRGVSVGLYGGSPETLRVFTSWLGRNYPSLRLACAIDPPFRPLGPEEDARFARLIDGSGAQLLLTGIGCPKQERWMAAHVARRSRDAGTDEAVGGAEAEANEQPIGLGCTMLGVGAAFDMLGGRTKDAPRWMRDRGLEWVYRLVTEPRRLWRRYLIQNPRFIAHFTVQFLRRRSR